MKKSHQKRIENPTVLKKLGINMLPRKLRTKVVYNDEEWLSNKVKGSSTYREDFKDYSMDDIQILKIDHPNVNKSTTEIYGQIPPSSPMTTTFRRNFKGEPGLPAKSCRPKWFAPDQSRQVGSTGYSYDYRTKPLPQQRSPPPTKIGNVLHTYPSNVLLPYTRPDQVISIWKPLRVLPPVNNVKSSDLLSALSKGSLSSTYRDDYLSIR
ncbi:uncharacterized protein LOC110248070 [Exaiptasia diaphana]|uniref:Uncharacterized protein n=1 Tax=Exaiptasia diaphana TaxID=2652724 RepID=A0A913XV13_EXADI|nr:uncharacterized protein LOC110248070 [Exaiptasia diaphana]KXJ24513.1 hypothetical protein AC249_AIPGENE9651 [Exaiptasia diaphana]